MTAYTIGRTRYAASLELGDLRLEAASPHIDHGVVRATLSAWNGALLFRDAVNLTSARSRHGTSQTTLPKKASSLEDDALVALEEACRRRPPEGRTRRRRGARRGRAMPSRDTRSSTTSTPSSAASSPTHQARPRRPHAVDRPHPPDGGLGLDAADWRSSRRNRLGQDPRARGDRAAGPAPGPGGQRHAGLPVPQGGRRRRARRRSSSTRSTPCSDRRRGTTRRSAACSTPATARAPSPAAASCAAKRS